MARKEAALDAVLPGWRHAAQRPRFVEGKCCGAVLQRSLPLAPTPSFCIFPSDWPCSQRHLQCGRVLISCPLCLAVLSCHQISLRCLSLAVDLLAGSLDLIPRLTAAGFDPSQRCCIVGEGLLPYLSPAQGSELLADLAALAAPGSHLLFDFMHEGWCEGSA